MKEKEAEKQVDNWKKSIMVGIIDYGMGGTFISL
jgi:hypothetical protein